MTAGVDGVAQSGDGEVGELLADRLEPSTQVLELSGHLTMMTGAPRHLTLSHHDG